MLFKFINCFQLIDGISSLVLVGVECADVFLAAIEVQSANWLGMSDSLLKLLMVSLVKT
ncbi:hypothetical protein RBSWK_00880 [Rhodopirellula baltica SWK14]|uniref:Uncharacterized protein n=1 Tax=Rhodopirellula baltica SWK14 TaxID=993516 RepID=L7CNJ3_RHOBT|nr:hypothetical protein RBSWK_00880 [Rhodopirellula baltica SWK14]